MLGRYELQYIQNLQISNPSVRADAARSLAASCRNLSISLSEPLSIEQRRQRNEMENALIQTLRQERDSDVRCAIVDSLADERTPSALQAIASVAHDPAVEVRYSVCHALYRCWEPQKRDEPDNVYIPKHIRIQELILSLYDRLKADPDPGVRMLAEEQYDNVEYQLNLSR